MSLTYENVGFFTFCNEWFLFESSSRLKLGSLYPYSDKFSKDKECCGKNRENLYSRTSFPAKISFSRQLNINIKAHRYRYLRTVHFQFQDYFTVGERVRFLFTTSGYKSYKRKNREKTCLLFLLYFLSTNSQF